MNIKNQVSAFFYQMFDEEIEEFKNFTAKQKAIVIYFLLSFTVLTILACCNSLLLAMIALANVSLSLWLMHKHIPMNNTTMP